ncbi:MAG: TonB C-terminal domain-containing protein [Vicinamibacterales bacterium]
MYLDFEDHRPETPRVPSVISIRTAIEVSLGLHLLFLLALVFFPSRFLEGPVEAATVVPKPEPTRFVFMRPPAEQPRTPPPDAVASDLDRRAMTIERPPDPVNRDPRSLGNTPDKVVGAPDEAIPAGPENNAPPAPSKPTPPAPDPATGLGLPIETPPPSPPSPPTGGRLGQSLRDLQRYLKDENLANPQGGFAEQGPDIQFDSKGVEFGPWLRRFVAQVKSNWYVPQAAQVMGDRRVVIQFFVHKNGAITDVKVVAESDVDGFNLSSFNAIKLSNPTLPLPAEYPDDKAFFTVIFNYYNRDDRE